MGTAIAVGGLVFSGLAIPDLLSEEQAFAPAWVLATTIAILAALGAIAVSSWFGSPRAVRFSAGATALVYLLSLATSIAAFDAGAALDHPSRLWLVTLSTIGASCASISFRPWLAWTYLAAEIVTIGVVQLATLGAGEYEQTALEALFDVFFAAVFVALGIATRRAGAVLDLAAERAVDEARRLATAEAVTRERSRADALVHDSILVALLAAGAGADERAERTQARSALDQIAGYQSENDPAPRDARELAWELQAVATAISPEASFTYEVRDPRQVPGQVVLALSEATAEALRNSVAYADPPHRGASRAVHVEVDSRGVEVTVLDDGRGFDPASVSSTRLGIAVSIRGRMRSEPGGSAIVVSRTGVGTRVTLRWRSAR